MSDYIFIDNIFILVKKKFYDKLFNINLYNFL